MFDEIQKIESVLVRVHGEGAREALRALDAIQRSLDEVCDAAQPHGDLWPGGSVEVWASRIAQLLRLRQPKVP
jgi:hypothetical protein